MAAFLGCLFSFVVIVFSILSYFAWQSQEQFLYNRESFPKIDLDLTPKQMPQDYVHIGLNKEDQKAIEEVRKEIGVKRNIEVHRFLVKKFLNEK